MKRKAKTVPAKKKPLYERICQILESARTAAARTVNTTQVVANWLVGREIVEEEQEGQRRAGYGERLIGDLSARLSSKFGVGYNLANLKFFRKFYLEYPQLFTGEKGYAVRSQSEASEGSAIVDIHPAVCGQSSGRFVNVGDLRRKHLWGR